MHTPDVNHRHAGWRESVKIVSHVKGALADIVGQTLAAGQLDVDYKTKIEPSILSASGDPVTDVCQAVVQRARLILDYYRRNF